MNWNQEETRILTAYTKRHERGLNSFFGYESMVHVMRMQERYRATMRLLCSFGFSSLADTRILDVGCGDGVMLRQFLEWGAVPANLSGIDLRADVIQKALQISALLDLRCGSAAQLPWADGQFDLVCQHTVFTSILDFRLKLQIASEIQRVLKTGGAILWYDFIYNNPHNPDVRGVNEQEIRALFPKLKLKLQKITLAPPIARKIPENLLPVLYPLLAMFPLLRTHYLGLFVEQNTLD